MKVIIIFFPITKEMKRTNNASTSGEDVMTTHVKVIQLENSHDRENVFRFLYGVWSDEFCRFMEGMDREHQLMKDALDETAQYVVAVDQSERILGCVRANILGNAALLPDLQII